MLVMTLSKENTTPNKYQEQHLSFSYIELLNWNIEYELNCVQMS